LAFDEGGYAGETGHMSVVPDAGVAVRDASARLDGGCLDEDDARAALREFAQMHEMPVGHVPVARRVLAHRRHDDAVARRDAAQLDRLEKQRLAHG